MIDARPNVGELIYAARVAAGLTQTQLADRAGVTQAALSRYESGLREIDPDVLIRLADGLGVTPEFLTSREHPVGGLAVDTHMRRRATAPATKWRQAEASLNLLRLHAERLAKHAVVAADKTIPGYDPLEVDPAAAARFTRMQWQMPTGPVRNLTAWVESAGIVIVERDLGSSARIDGMTQWGSGVPFVMLNGNAPTDRKRLTLAHELGHVVLHRSDIPTDPEDQANLFAAEFLMPEAVIRPQLRRLTLSKARALKLEWGVSIAAIIMRAKGLGVITPAQATSLFKQLSARGWRVQEPDGEVLAPEQPQLFDAVGQALRQRFSAHEIATIAGVSDDQLDALLPSRRLRSV